MDRPIEPTTTCHRCGETRDPDDPSALLWTSERDTAGRLAWLCPSCARAHIRDIEATLPTDYW